MESSKLHYDILDTHRRNILPLLGHFTDRFYLAGGTALALYLGHRDSIDFDFFTEHEFAPQEFLAECERIFINHNIIATQIESGTLTIIIDQNIKISFFYYPYQLLQEKHRDQHLVLASVPDISCMKLSAITGRSSLKDYVDLYWILQSHSLETLLEWSGQKFPSLDPNVILKSLVYLEDMDNELVDFKNGFVITIEEIERYMKQLVSDTIDIL